MGKIKRKITGEDKARRAQREAERLAQQQRIKDTNSAIMQSQGSAYESMGGVTNAGGSASDVGIKRRRGGGRGSSSLGL